MKKIISVSEKDFPAYHKHHEDKLNEAIIKTQEDERYEIGSELHDNVCQILAASQLTLSMLKDSFPASKLKLFYQLKHYLEISLEEIRNLSHRLAPAFYNNSTLASAFNKLFELLNIEDKYIISVHFDQAFLEKNFSMELQLNLYRILQEQLKNIIKYAQATQIQVNMLLVEGELVMEISDNGKGFNTDKVSAGIGIANMKRRAELFLGKFNIVSSPGNGCTVAVTIPLSKEIE